MGYNLSEEDVKCPVCKGSGQAYSVETGEYDGPSCHSCSGTGLAPWCKRFNDLIALGKIKEPIMPKAKKKPKIVELPIHIKLSQWTADYPEYFQAAKSDGLNPLKRNYMTHERTKYTKLGYEGLQWKKRWDEESKKIAMECENYTHFIILCDRSERRTGKKLSMKSKSAVNMLRIRHGKPNMSNSKYAICNDTKIEFSMKFTGITSKAFKKFKSGCGEWQIYESSYDNLGTAKDLFDYVQARKGSKSKPSRKDYGQWLREKTERE